MSWDSIKSTIAKYAPLAGSLLGGPAGGSIGTLIASALGVEDSPAAIEAAIKQDPQALAKLKQFDHEYRTQLANIRLETLRVELLDKQNARKQHKDHWMPAALTIALAVMVMSMFAAMVWAEIPESIDDQLTFLAGQVVGAFMTAVAYWLGTSRSSKEKNDKLVQS